MDKKSRVFFDIEIQLNNGFLEKKVCIFFTKFLQNRKFVVNLHHNKTETHGVAVTLLILVQSSGVRIPVGLQIALNGKGNI